MLSILKEQPQREDMLTKVCFEDRDDTQPRGNRRGTLEELARRPSQQCSAVSRSVLPNRMLSPKEVAVIIGFGVDKVRRLVRRGELRALILPQESKRKNKHERMMIYPDSLREFLRRYSSKEAA